MDEKKGPCSSEPLPVKLETGFNHVVFDGASLKHYVDGELRSNEATITVADADDVLDALAASIADGDIDYDDITGPVGAKRAALELLREVRIGLAIDPSSNRLRNEPDPIGTVACINCGKSSDDPTGSACPSGGGPQHDWEERVDGPPITWTPNADAGDSSGHCSCCGQERDEPHAWKECAEHSAREVERWNGIAHDPEWAIQLLRDTVRPTRPRAADAHREACRILSELGVFSPERVRKLSAMLRDRLSAGARTETALPPVIVAVIEAAEALAERLWSDDRTDEEQEAICKAVQAMRAVETGSEGQR